MSGPCTRRCRSWLTREAQVLVISLLSWHHRPCYWTFCSAVLCSGPYATPRRGSSPVELIAGKIDGYPDYSWTKGVLDHLDTLACRRDDPVLPRRWRPQVKGLGLGEGK